MALPARAHTVILRLLAALWAGAILTLLSGSYLLPQHPELGIWLLDALEHAHSRPTEAELSSCAGVLVLGGGLDTFVDARGIPHGPGERINAAMELARLLPSA